MCRKHFRQNIEIEVQRAVSTDWKGKAFCERRFAMHRQQPEKYNENCDVLPLEKFLLTPVVALISI